MLNSSQVFLKYFCPTLFSELESCAVEYLCYLIEFFFKGDNNIIALKQQILGMI